MLYRKVTEPCVVTLLAIINVSEKEALSWKFYLHRRGWKCYCCYFICTQSGESLEEMSIIWCSFKVSSLFLGGSTDYLQEGWVIPRQVGADFSSPLLKAARERDVTKPGSPDMPSSEVAKAFRHSEVISYSHTGTMSPRVTASSAGGNKAHSCDSGWSENTGSIYDSIPSNVIILTASVFATILWAWNSSFPGNSVNFPHHHTYQNPAN